MLRKIAKKGQDNRKDSQKRKEARFPLVLRNRKKTRKKLSKIKVKNALMRNFLKKRQRLPLLPLKKKKTGLENIY